MPCIKILSIVVFLIFNFINTSASFASETDENNKEIYLGINTADVREDTSSVQFLNLFSSAIPFSETVPWGSSKEVTYDKYGWPNDLKDGKAGTKFLNRLPEDTVEDGFFTVLYDGEGEIFYGNDARLVVHRPNKDIIEIRAGKDKILNASLFIKKSNPDNYIRNIRILPEGGICKGIAHIRVKSKADCVGSEYLSFEDNHLNPWAKEQREKLSLEKGRKDKTDKSDSQESTEESTETKDIAKPTLENTIKSKTKVAEIKLEYKKEKKGTKDTKEEEEKTELITSDKKKDDNSKLTKDTTSEITTTEKPKENSANKTTKIAKVDKDAFQVKGFTDLTKALVFNPEYLDFMKDFQMIRFMNMSGMTRNPVVKWDKRNTLKKATWGGKYGSRGAPVEVMVALSNDTSAYPWFSMPYKANDDYIKQFGKYVNKHLKPELKSYIEYSNEVWNPIFIHHDYAIQQGVKQKLDKKKSQAGYKWYSKRSVQTFKIWEKAFGGTDRLIRVMGSWASNQIMSSTVLKYRDAYKNTDAIAIGPYFSALPRVLRRAKTVDDVFKSMLDKKTKWGMRSTVDYIKKQVKVANSYGVDLVAYEGGQHLVDWNTRKAEEHPNPLLYAANRDPRMGILYDELMNEWHRAGGKLFVAFSAPRIYSWYGSWGIKEHIRQARSDAPKYDSLLRYLNARLYPKNLPLAGVNTKELDAMSGEVKNINIGYAKTPQMIWDMSRQRQIKTDLKDIQPRDIDAHWQANWDTKNLYLSFAINDDDLHQGDSIRLTFDTTTAEQDSERAKEQEKLDIANEKALLEKKKKAKAARKLEYERIAKEKKEKELALAKDKDKDKDKEKEEKGAETEKGDSENTDDKQEIAIKMSEKKTTVKALLSTLNGSTNKGVKDETTSSKPSKLEKTVDTSVDSKTKKAMIKDSEVSNSKAEKTTLKKEAVSNVKVADKDVNVENEEEKVDDEVAIQEGEKPETGFNKTFNENVITFTFTPFDDLNKHSRATSTDSGYLINAAIPWSEIYYDTDVTEIRMKSGDRLGVNITVNDVDKDEKGNKELISADTNLALPKLILKNIIIE